MEKHLKKFFKELVESPSPSGFEQPAQEVFRNFVDELADEVVTDVHGNVIAMKKGTGKLNFMISGHADEIGFMIKYIDDKGYIYFSKIGGIDAVLLPGLRVNIYHGNKKIKGVFGRKAVHLLGSDKSKAPTMDDLWIDIGAKDKKSAEKKVSIGDPITFSSSMESLSSDLIVTKAADNKCGVFVAAAILDLLKDEKLFANIFSVSSVQEEVGLRGAKTSAYSVNPDISIAVDCTFSTDLPNSSKKKHGDIEVRKGPAIAVGSSINPQVFELLKNAAKKAKIDFQIEPCASGTGTEADAHQITRGGIAAGLVSIPVRYMHSPNEVLSLKDLEATVKLIAQFAKDLTEDVNLIP